MHKTTLNLAAIVAAALLAACGGGSDDAITPADNGNRNAGNVTPSPNNGGNTGTRSGRILVPAPAQPTAAETAAFDARKAGSQQAEIIGGNVFRPITITVNNRPFIKSERRGSGYVSIHDYRSLPSGYASLSGVATDDSGSTTVNVRSYQGFRSGVAATYNGNEFLTIERYGAITPESAVPRAGRATYTGIAFDQGERGTFTYNVDFGARRGSGNVRNMARYGGGITLAEAPFHTYTRQDGSISTDISGYASGLLDDYQYLLSFYGNRAEEIAGFVAGEELEAIGLHGTRGAITE